MSLLLHTTLTLSCETGEDESGPTLVHCTGVPSYRVSPEVIRILQETLTNDNLCDDEFGVRCTDPPAKVIEVFESNGFEVISVHGNASRKMWTISKTS